MYIWTEIEYLEVNLIPVATPMAWLKKLALLTIFPAAVDAVCVPCPSESRGDRNVPVAFNRPTIAS